MVNQVSTSMQYNNFANNINNLQNKINKTNDKIDGKIENFAALSANKKVEQWINTQYSINSIENYIYTNEVVEGRLISMDQTFDNIISIASNMKKDLALKNKLTGKSLNITQIAKAYLASIQDSLNTSYEGRYLFAGSKIDIKPVNDLSKSNLINNIPSSNYYQGDNYIFNTKISDSFSLDYGITASDSSFINLIGSINLIINYEKTNDQNTFINASKMLDDSINNLIQSRSILGNNLRNVQQTLDSNNSMLLYYRNKEDSVTPNDFPQIITELSNDKIALEALYRSFSIISKLSIKDYI